MLAITHRVLRFAFFTVIVRPIIHIILGLNVRHREKLPHDGPAVICANHNSHLDTMVLISLLRHRLLHRVRPVAAADYFLRNRVLAWFSTHVIGILPIARRRTGPDDDPLAACREALRRGDILIFFPEGSRGEPEHLTEFRGGIAKIAHSLPEVPIVPIYLYGLGKALPKGEALLVPFFVDVFVGDPLTGGEHGADFLPALTTRMRELHDEGNHDAWD